MSIALILETKVVGRRTPFEQRPLSLSNELGPTPTLRQLLTALVAGEVAAYNERQQTLNFLTSRELKVGAAAGKVVFSPQLQGPQVIEAEATAIALQAFEDGLYYVFLDDQQLEDLDAPVPLQSASTLLLLRLTALAGG